jgi:hypothetical protein
MGGADLTVTFVLFVFFFVTFFLLPLSLDKNEPYHIDEFIVDVISDMDEIDQSMKIHKMDEKIQPWEGGEKNLTNFSQYP